MRHCARRAPATLFALLAACLIDPSEARVTAIRVDSIEPFAEPAAFGATGAYERLKGRFRGELDPADARNKVIVDLDKAPRNAGGKVEYETDFFMLRPVDATRGNRTLIYDVTNRGRMYVHWRLMDAKLASPASGNDPRTAADAGNGLFLRRGYTLVWSGWDSTVAEGANRLRLTPVVATDNGKPIVRTIRDELVSGTRGAARTTFRLTHAAATLDQARAKLTVRRAETDMRPEVPASQWAYVNAREIRLLPEGTKPEPGSLYEFHYPATDPHVLGIGMAVTRDFIAFLRSGRADDAGSPNPVRFETRAALAFGISQSGRFLRDFVRDGFNQDERGGKVFDGMLAHTAGVGGVFLNHAFGQPARTNTQHEDHAFPENAFPFSTARMTDPVTGTTGSLMRNDGFDPLWMETNTSTEYGNETSGVRLPEIGVPLGTYTGWNLYREPYPQGELCDRNGSYKPFARTQAEREAAGDPRPSLAERYGDPARYVKRFEEEARRLVNERLLLAEDAGQLIARAKESEIAQRFVATAVAGAADDAAPTAAASKR